LDQQDQELSIDDGGSTGTESGSDWGNAGGSGMGDTIGSTGTESGSDWGNAGGSGMGDAGGTDMGGTDTGGTELGDDMTSQEDSGQGI
jgi:hypothetical protein